MAREIINIHVGQAGCEVGNACWELFCKEHNISTEGKIENREGNECIQTFFHETNEEKFVPRAIFVDSACAVIDGIKSSSHGSIFDEEYMVAGTEDADKNYTKGRSSIGASISPGVIDKIKKLAEECDNVQGFIFTHSVGGGTGSGLVSSLMESLGSEFKKKTICDFAIYPGSPLFSNDFEPLNCLLSTNSNLDHSNLTCVFDNDAIYDICRSNYNIESPTYSDMNHLVAQVISSVTSDFRHDGASNVFLYDLVKDLVVPNNRLQFLCPAFKPGTNGLNVTELTNDVFDSGNQMVKFDKDEGKYLACRMIYKGDIESKMANLAVQNLQTNGKLQFVDWVPTHPTVSLTSCPTKWLSGSDTVAEKRSVCMVSNHTSISDYFSRLATKFDQLYVQKEKVKLYLGDSGMADHDLEYARENIENLLKDYNDVLIPVSQEDVDEDY